MIKSWILEWNEITDIVKITSYKKLYSYITKGKGRILNFLEIIGKSFYGEMEKENFWYKWSLPTFYDGGKDFFYYLLITRKNKNIFTKHIIFLPLKCKAKEFSNYELENILREKIEGSGRAEEKGSEPFLR